MIGVAAVVDRRQRQGHFVAFLRSVAANAFADLGDHVGIQAGRVMYAVVLGRADRDKHHVVLAALLHRDVTRGILDVGAALAQLGFRRQAVLLEDLVDFFLRCFPHCFLQQTRGVVLKLDARIIRHPPGFAHDFFFVGFARHN